MPWIGKLIMRWPAGWWFVILAPGVPAFAAAELASAPAATVAAASTPQATGRLRFKSAGPVCMCGEGMSERDIENAMRQQALGRPGAEGASSAVVEEQNRAAMESKIPKGGVTR